MGNKDTDHSDARRKFLKRSAVIGGVSLLPAPITGLADFTKVEKIRNTVSGSSIIGGYGPWAAGLVDKPPLLSFRKEEWDDISLWRTNAMRMAHELIASPELSGVPEVSLDREYQFEGLDIEEISWQLPYGHRTEAVVLKPQGHKGPLPAILGLHDHAGNKYFGVRKITKTSHDQHPVMAEHQAHYYESNAWANELALRGYVVLVHDAFAFASRRVLFEEMSEIPWGHCSTKGLFDEDPEKPENIENYNRWAAEHEHIMAKSLFCSGTTWPGVFFAEDKIALDILSARDDVDPKRLGCAGLSGGGLRTVMLGGLDHRIQCAVCAGFMTTWNDLLLHKSYTHTWMSYIPLLPKYLDFPEILGLRAPLPAMVLNSHQDNLFTPSGMREGTNMLVEIYHKAGAPDHFSGLFYDGGHKFDKQMQADAFNWFDRWLSGI
jgi:dienelactone hydrolase